MNLVLAWFLSLLAVSAEAALRPHFDPPDFLLVEAELDRPPEIGKEVTLRVRLEARHVESLEIVIELQLPAGLRWIGPLPPAKTRVSGEKPLAFSVRVVADRELSRSAIGVVARTPFPSEALRRYYLAHSPLYGGRARREFVSLTRDPPRDHEVRRVLAFSVSREEAVLGVNPSAPVYIGAKGLPFALERIECDEPQAAERTWRELLIALDAGKLTDPAGWCRLHLLALAQLREGRPLAAAGAWQAMLSRLSKARESASYRPALESGLAAALAESGRGDDARRLWESIAPSPLSAHVAFNLATSFHRAGNRAAAIARYRAALQLSPGYTLARRRLEQLDAR